MLAQQHHAHMHKHTHAYTDARRSWLGQFRIGCLINQLIRHVPWWRHKLRAG
jgi:hypothetical protein